MISKKTNENPRMFNGLKYKFHQFVFTTEYREEIKIRLKKDNYSVRCIYVYGAFYLGRTWTKMIKIYKRKK